MKVLLQAAVVWGLRSRWEREELVARLSFVSWLPHYLFKNMLDRGSFDLRVIGARNGEEEERDEAPLLPTGSPFDQSDY